MRSLHASLQSPCTHAHAHTACSCGPPPTHACSLPVHTSASLAAPFWPPHMATPLNDTINPQSLEISSPFPKKRDMILTSAPIRQGTSSTPHHGSHFRLFPMTTLQRPGASGARPVVLAGTGASCTLISTGAGAPPVGSLVFATARATLA